MNELTISQNFDFKLHVRLDWGTDDARQTRLASGSRSQVQTSTGPEMVCAQVVALSNCPIKLKWGHRVAEGAFQRVSRFTIY